MLNLQPGAKHPDCMERINTTEGRMLLHYQSGIPVFNRIPMTLIKIWIARILYRVIRQILRKDKHLICRNGVYYEVDLAEGIDLSLFLFGNFQGHVTCQRYFSIPASAVIIDVGANIGSMALRFAQSLTDGHVYAFEPTNYAFNKLLRNISLNSVLADRITPIQSFLSDRTESDHNIKAYSSWKVDGSGSETHPLHGGSIKSAELVPAVTLDHFCSTNRICRIDLIKIDTDGYELHVLKGAAETIKRFHPYIIFEIGLYVLEEREERFEDYFFYLSSFKYDLINSKNGKKITLENCYQQIPLRSTTDIIAVPL